MSCLPSAAKLLESVVCEQLCHYFEINNLLPSTQHGFRAKRSTMTAWAEVQQLWAKNTTNKETTGVLLWDLSAAFDCLDKEILCKKLALDGLDDKLVNWFGSFLSERSQIVKIADSLSEPCKLNSGVPLRGYYFSSLIYHLRGRSAGLA